MKKILLVGIVGLSSMLGVFSASASQPNWVLSAEGTTAEMWDENDDSGNMLVINKTTGEMTDYFTGEVVGVMSGSEDSNLVTITDNDGNKHTILIKDVPGGVFKSVESTNPNGRPNGEVGQDRPVPGDMVTPDRPRPPSLADKVDAVNDYLSQAGSAIQNNSNKIDALGQAFQAQAAHTASEITRLDGRIDSLEQKTDKLKAGVAGATAIASLTQYVGSGSHHVAVGIGGYDGASALAAGYTYAISANTTVRATVALDSEDEVAFGASVGHSW